jgi:hypothetical protein
LDHVVETAAGAEACTCAKRAHALVTRILAFPLPQTGPGVLTMLMFKRSQLYIGLALAGLAEIIVRAMSH